MKASTQVKSTLFNLLQETKSARLLELVLPSNPLKPIQTPSYVLSTNSQNFLKQNNYSGALRGLIKHNLKDLDYPMVSLNFHDMHANEYTKTLRKYKQHLQQQDGGSAGHLKRYFKYEDKFLMMSPFNYSRDKEHVSGFNDEINFLINGKLKVNVKDYYDMIMENEADIVVAPCEQITFTSGKKKRKRSQKAALKNFEVLQKLMRDHNKKETILMPVILGDEDGMDTYELRQLQKTLIEQNTEDSLLYHGFFIYGTDQLISPAAYQELKDFFALVPTSKLRVLHGPGSPIEILTAVLSGVDVFESDYPLSLAEKGLALLINNIQNIHVEEQKSINSELTPLELAKQMYNKRPITIQLADEEHKSIKDPLVKGCQCYTCQNYNRAYLYHLLEVKEMNANILIAMQQKQFQHQQSQCMVI